MEWRGKIGVHAIVVPMPGQGHINPMMQLAKKLASKGIAITFVLTQSWHNIIAKAHSTNRVNAFTHAQNIGLNIRLADIPDCVPGEFERWKKIEDFFQSLDNMESHVEELIKNLNQSSATPVSCIVADTFLGWAVPLAKKLGLLSVSFWPQSVSVFSFSYHSYLGGRPAGLVRHIPGVIPLLHRLEMQKMETKMNYKSLTRQRCALLGSLTTHIDGSEGGDPAAARRALEELAEVLAKLDHLADELHSVTQQLANLRSLGDVHSASALAMALRKLNSSFLKQVAETQLLRQQVSSLEAERDEAWTQAEGVAQEYDELIDRYGEDPQIPRTSKFPSSRCSSRISAIRKSSIRVSKAGLRSASLRRSQRSSVGSSRHGHRGSESIPSTADIPPVPPMPHVMNLGISTTDLPSRSSLAESTSSPSSGTRAMIRAQEELYELLVAMSIPKGERTRPLSVTSPSNHSRHALSNSKPPNSRPLSDIVTPGLGTSSIPGSARVNGLYTDNSEAMLAATMSVITN